MLLGFYIFQGIKSSEAKKILVEDIDLTNYKIYLRGDKRTDERVVSLKIKQILLISDYLLNERKKLKNYHKSNSLILTNGDVHSQQNTLQRLTEKLREQNKYFVALSQIRNSVISI